MYFYFLYIQQWSLNKKLSIQTHLSTTWEIFWDLHQETDLNKIESRFLYTLHPFELFCVKFNVFSIPWGPMKREWQKLISSSLFVSLSLAKKNPPWVNFEARAWIQNLLYTRTAKERRTSFLHVIQHLLKTFVDAKKTSWSQKKKYVFQSPMLY